jgi:hypothetical protein
MYSEFSPLLDEKKMEEIRRCRGVSCEVVGFYVYGLPREW